MIQYHIQTWQESYGERRWHFIIKKYRRVIFKRSKREGWRGEGFVRTEHGDMTFATRPEALACAQADKKGIQ